MFSQKGVSDKIRGKIWCKIVKVDEIKKGYAEGIYHKLKSLDNFEIRNLITRDEISTRSDLRLNPGSNECVNVNP